MKKVKSRVVSMQRLAHGDIHGSRVIEMGSAVFGKTGIVMGEVDGEDQIYHRQTGVGIVCDGEIENQESLRGWLRTRRRNVTGPGGTAVLHQLYLELGPVFVRELEGRFAMAVWDPRRCQVILARDRSGERPLFYHRSRAEVIFATELSTLIRGADLAHAVDLDPLPTGLELFSSPGSSLLEIQRVSRAEIVCLNSEGSNTRRYCRRA